MDKILQSSEVNSIEPLVRNSLKRMAENDTHPHLVKRFIERFEGDLNFELRQNHNEKEQRNIKEALHLFHKKESAKNK
jgi:hypothetical protein